MMIEERTRRHSYEHAVSTSSLSPTSANTVGALTPDRSSRLPTSKTPHHRTNFPQAYKPPVAPGYEPPPNPPARYRHPLPDGCAASAPATKAFAAAMRGPKGAALSVEIPFDQANDDHKGVAVAAAHDDADSQPGRIKPATTPPKHPPPVRVATPTEMKPIISNPVGSSTFRSSSPVPGSSPTEIKNSSSYRPNSPGPMAQLEIKTYSSNRSPSPGPMSPLEIRTTSSHRSRSPALMAPPEIRTTLSHRSRSPGPMAPPENRTRRSNSPGPMPSPEIRTHRSRSPGHMPPLEIKTSPSYRSPSPGPVAPPEIRSTLPPSPVPMRVPSSPSRSQQTNSSSSSSARQVATSPAMPFDEAPTRVTPSPTNAAGGSAVNRSRKMQRSRGPPSPARASPLTTALLASDHVGHHPLEVPQPSLSGGYRMAPPRVSVPMPRPCVETYEDEPSALTGDFSLENPRCAVAASPVKAAAAIDQDDDDDDSLFDFEERSKRDKVCQQDRNNRRASNEESDENSQEDNLESLQQRTRAAWKRKHRLNAAAASTLPKSDAGQSPPVVSFGKNDIVHNYYPQDSVDVDDAFDNTTLGGHSMNSLYTKSAESEVEDILKDIFMIGSGEGTNPGRRKFKHNPRIIEHIERKSRDEGEITDEETLNTYDDEDTATHEDTTATYTDTTGMGTGFDTATYEGETATEDSPSNDFSFLPMPLMHPLMKKKSRPDKKGMSSPMKREVDLDEKKEEDPLTEAWAFVENKISAVGAALGIESQGEASTPSSEENSPKSALPKEDTEKSGWDIWQFLVGPTAPLFCENPNSSSSEDYAMKVDTVPSLEEDIRLVDLAVQAAMSVHRLNGYEFDTSHDIDIANDIKFSVVDLALPLGVIFQENEKGCWVTQILRDGSAAASNGNIQVGDQLAAVDGASAIDMTVDEIAKLIRVKKKEIELTFVRYVGPLRPEVGSVVQEEGYEISAKETPPRKKLTWSPPSSPKQKTKITATPPKASPSSPKKGILKKDPKPVVTAKARKVKSPTAAPATAQKKENETKKKFRLFGRRN